MPTARGGLSTSVVDGIIYAIGGRVIGDLSTVEAYDPATDTWEAKADMPTARWAFSTSVVNRTIYAIGGWIGGTDGFSVWTVEAYDPANDVWTAKADMSISRGAPSASTVNGHIYAIGGSSNGIVPLTLVEEYDAGFTTVGSTGKLPTKWGEVKSE
jgi:hypothetical protein